MSERDEFTKEPADTGQGMYRVHVFLFKHPPYTAGNVYNKRIQGTRAEVDQTVAQIRNYYHDLGYPDKKIQIKVEKIQ